MDNIKTEPIFSRLGSLCRYVNTQTNELKNELNTPFGQKPHNYDRGLKTLKKEVEDLKKLSAELRQKLAPVSNFSSYLLSTQELVSQQSMDIDKIEKYLMTFGYTPLPKQEEITNNTEVSVEEARPSIQIDSASPARTKEVDNLRNEGTPVLSSVGQMVVQGKDFPPAAASEPIHQQNSIHLKTPTTTRIQNKYQEEAKVTYSLNTLSQSSMTVDQWLAGVDNAVEVTPDVLRVYNEPMRQKVDQKLVQHERETSQVKITPPREADSRHCKGAQKREEQSCATPVSHKVEAYKANNNCMPSTPSEPHLSEYTTSLFSLINAKARQELTTKNMKEESETLKMPAVRPFNTATPEEPGLSSFTSFSSKEKKIDSVATPEEPTLSYSDKLAHVKNTNKENCTPEEPILSYKNLQKEKTKQADERTPEEPFLSSSHNRHHPQSYSDDPLSPQLSDVTRSVLSLSRNPSYSQYSHGKVEVYSHKAPTEVCQKEISYGASLKRVKSFPSSTELGSFSRSMMERGNHPQSFSEVASNCEESNQRDKVPWHRPGLTLEQALQIDDVPASPQLSDITQRVIGMSKRW